MHRFLILFKAQWTPWMKLHHHFVASLFCFIICKCLRGDFLLKTWRGNKEFLSPNARSKNDYWEEIKQPKWLMLTESLHEVLSLNFRCFPLTVCLHFGFYTSSSSSSSSSSKTLLRQSCRAGTIPPPTSTQGYTPQLPVCGSISTGGRGGEFPFKVPHELTLEPPTVTSLWEDGLQIKRNNISLEVLQI